MADEAKTVSRREFLTGIGGAGMGAVIGGLAVKGFWLENKVFAVPAAEGYLLVDTMKCSGCSTCMLACSIAHYGESSMSLSRIQVTADYFASFPEGITQFQCRQCPYPSCVDACPVGAMTADAENGYVRTVDEDKCIGCERCINACTFTPSRVQWNPRDRHAQKCDLCANTPYWDQDGGPAGKQACVEMCPLNAISFTNEIPVQNDSGYQVNLRDDVWGGLNFPTGDDGEFTTATSASGGGHG